MNRGLEDNKGIEKEPNKQRNLIASPEWIKYYEQLLREDRLEFTIKSP